MNKSEILEEAMSAVKARGESYGDVAENFQRIADFWNVWLKHRGMLADGAELDTLDVAMLNDLQKNARLVETPAHKDSIVDKAGYAACYGAIALAKPRAPALRPISVDEMETLRRQQPAGAQYRVSD